MRARKTERFQAALVELRDYVEAQGFEARGGFHAWGRLQVLVTGLQRAYDYFELEGDVAPVRREVDAYHADLANLGLRPDKWAAPRLAQLVADLEAPEPVLELRISAAPAPEWPSSILAIRPEELEALLHERVRRRVSGG